MKRKLFSLFAAIVFVAALFTLPASAAIVQDIPTEHQQGKVLICEYTREAGVSADFNAILQFRAEAASGNVAWPIFVSVKSDCIMGSTGSGSLNEKLCTLDPDTKYEVIVLLANTTTTGYRCHYRVYVNGVCITKNKWTSPVDVIETSTGGSYDTMKWTKIDYKCPFAFVGALNSIDQFDEDAYKAFITGSSDSAVAITSSDSGFDGFGMVISDEKTAADVKSALTLSAGAALSITRDDSELSSDVVLKTGDKVIVTSSNSKTVNTYAVTIKTVEITSEVYTIDNSASAIKGILKYTKLEQILKNIKTAEGYAIDGIYNGDVKVSTNAFVENGYTLKLTNGSTYSLTLKDSTVAPKADYAYVNLKESFNWPAASSTNNIMLLEFTLPKTVSSDVEIRPVVNLDAGGISANFIFLYDSSNCRIANNWSENYLDILNEKVGNAESIDFKLIVDLKSESAVLYANGKFIAEVKSDIFKRYFTNGGNNNTGAYQQVYMNHIYNTLTCTYIENKENCEKDISADKYDVLTVSENDGALSASTLAYSNGMMIFASYDETSGRLLNVKCVDTQERTACTAELEAPKNTGKVKVFLWSDELVPKAVYEK